MTTTTLVYCRVSTSGQAESGLGIESQATACHTYADIRGWGTDIEVLEENGRSGMIESPERPVLAEALRRLADPDDPAHYLVAAAIDRLSRSATDTLALAEAAGREGWQFGTPDFSLDPESAIGRYVLTIISASGRLYRDMGAERTSQALAAKAARGERAGGKVQLPQDVRERIRWQREVLGMTLQQIANGLTAKGVPTARGGRWHPSTVRSVLRSLAYDDELAARRRAQDEYNGT